MIDQISDAQEPGTGNPEISIVVPAFNEEGNIRRLCEELVRSIAPLRVRWNAILVDDGSSDQTWTEILALHAEHEHVVGLRLSRNFGHQYALFAGLAHATGDAVISMDADLQHPPELLPRLIAEWRRGSKVVHTVRADYGSSGFFKRITSRLFYRIFSLLSGSQVEPGMADFRLLDRQVLDHLLQFNEEGLFLRGLVQWVGFPSSRVTFECRERHSGGTKYSLRGMIRFAWTGLTSFSLTPLRAAIFIGIMTSMLAFASIVYATGAYILGLRTVPGWASILSIVSFQFGVMFILLGIIGEYVGKILLEVKRRPRYLVSEQVGMGLLRTDAPNAGSTPARPVRTAAAARSKLSARQPIAADRTGEESRGRPSTLPPTP
jgi:polyisoprenyl-phosphate glycosyltransferase